MSIELFTPPSLAHLLEPPTFSLRAAKDREYRRYQHILREEGLHYPSDEEIRGEVRRAVAALYTPEQASAALARLEAFWSAADKGEPPAPGESAAVQDLNERLAEAWPRLARLGAARVQFEREASNIAVALFVVGWSGVPVPFRLGDPFGRDLGRVPLAVVDDLEEALHSLQAQSSSDGGGATAAPRGLAFAELCNAAFARLRGGSALSEASPTPAPRRRRGASAPPKSSPNRGKAKPPTRPAASARKAKGS